MINLSSSRIAVSYWLAVDRSMRQRANQKTLPSMLTHVAVTAHRQLLAYFRFPKCELPSIELQGARPMGALLLFAPRARRSNYLCT
jgi:hypothetical protein